MMIKIILSLCIALVIYSIVLQIATKQDVRGLVICYRYQQKEIDKLRDLIKDSETDAIVQLRGSAQHADKEIKGIKKDITERLNMLWEALETTSKILEEKINETNKGQNDEQNKIE